MQKSESNRYEIELMDGHKLECYPNVEPEEAIDNTLSLDTTGTYLVVGKNRSAKRQPPTQDEAEERRKLERKAFLDNAFLFIENRERIMSDSRMFLCPIPIQSGIAYTGTSGFRRPTLGVYLEWWLNCPAANVWDGKEDKWLVYQLAGSPLSGMNKCGLVNQRGETKCESQSNFSAMWPKFQKVNCRYDEAKTTCQAYTIHEVLAILEQEGKNVVYDKDIYLYFLERANQGLEMRLKRMHDYANEVYKNWHRALMANKKAELRAFLDEYYAMKARADQRLAEIQEVRFALRKRMKSGEITPKQYQREWTPYGKERNRVKYEANSFLYDKLRELIPESHISLWEIEDFLDLEDGQPDGQAAQS